MKKVNSYIQKMNEFLSQCWHYNCRRKIMWLHKILFIQALYYFVSGLWPIVHMASFEKVTGPKNDKWLVQTVSALILCSSLIFFYSAFFRNVSMPLETVILSIANCLALAFVDIYFVIKKMIKKIYLLDAVFELIIFCAVILSLM